MVESMLQLLKNRRLKSWNERCSHMLATKALGHLSKQSTANKQRDNKGTFSLIAEIWKWCEKNLKTATGKSARPLDMHTPQKNKHKCLPKSLPRKKFIFQPQCLRCYNCFRVCGCLSHLPSFSRNLSPRSRDTGDFNDFAWEVGNQSACCLRWCHFFPSFSFPACKKQIKSLKKVQKTSHLGASTSSPNHSDFQTKYVYVTLNFILYNFIISVYSFDLFV